MHAWMHAWMHAYIHASIHAGVEGPRVWVRGLCESGRKNTETCHKYILGLNLVIFGPKLDVWIEDGSRMDRVWIEDGSRMDRGWIEVGSRMDRGWIEDGGLCWSVGCLAEQRHTPSPWAPPRGKKIAQGWPQKRRLPLVSQGLDGWSCINGQASRCL